MTIPAVAPQDRAVPPPIVLLVEEQRDALARYTHGLEDSGYWVAATTLAAEAVAAAEDLKPDIIVVDCGTDETWDVVVGPLRHHRTLGEVPLIVLAADARHHAEADNLLVKPVEMSLLLQRTHELLGRSRALRSRSQQVVERGSQLRERSNRLLATSARMTRPCPACGAALDWVERTVIGGLTYDSYRWCLKGCGLYCFDRDHDTWIKVG